MEVGDLSNKIAICFSGQVRTFIHTFSKIKYFIGNQNVDYFVHTWDQNTVLPYIIDVGFTSNEYKPATSVDRQHIELIRTIFKPINMQVDNLHKYAHKSEQAVIARTGRPPVSHVNLFHSMYEANRMKILHEERSKSKYRYVLKLRFDTVFDAEEKLYDQLKYMVMRPLDNVIYTKDFMNKLPEAVEDVCIIGTSSAMDVASEFVRYRESDPDFVKVDWQHRFAEYLKEKNIEVRPWLNNNLYIYRDEHRAAGLTSNTIRGAE